MKIVNGMFVAGILAVALAMCAVSYWRQHGDANAPAFHQMRSATRADEIVSSLSSNMWTRSFDAYRSLQELEEILRDIPEGDVRKDLVLECGRKFVSMEIDIEDRVRRRSNADNYIEFARALLRLQAKNGVEEDEFIDFFFKALEKNKSVCMAPIPNEDEMGYDVWSRWNNTSGWLQFNLKSNLDRIRSDLFSTFFVGVSEEGKASISSRFSRFYVATTNEIVQADAYRREHGRRPPPRWHVKKDK